MNFYTKMLLIPEDEYYKLKSVGTDKVTRALQKALPPQLRQNIVNKAIDEMRDESFIPKTPTTQDSFSSFASPKMEWDAEQESVLKRLENILTPAGVRIKNQDQRTLKGSDVNRVLDFLKASSPIPRGPSGYKNVVQELVSQGAPTDFINQPKAAIYAAELEKALRDIEKEESLYEPSTSQKGKGWQSIGNF